MTAQIALLPDGRRLHLQQGPIDLVIEAFGTRDEVAVSYRQAAQRFETILSELVEELASLRQPVRAPRWRPAGAIAQRMMAATWPHRDVFVTAMAAVAGAVADETLQALVAGRTLDKAYVNNSGDIAIHLAQGAGLRLGIVGELMRPGINGTALLTHALPVRGVATSGWQGRSWSFGIADAVTVLAADAAAADVAATLIANDVNIDHPAIERAPACDLDDQTDLGDRLVTVAVGDLEPDAVEAALAGGVRTAARMAEKGLIAGAVLVLGGEMRVVGDVPASLPATA